MGRTWLTRQKKIKDKNKLNDSNLIAADWGDANFWIQHGCPWSSSASGEDKKVMNVKVNVGLQQDRIELLRGRTWSSQDSWLDEGDGGSVGGQYGCCWVCPRFCVLVWRRRETAGRLQTLTRALNKQTRWVRGTETRKEGNKSILLLFYSTTYSPFKQCLKYKKKP